MTKKIRVESLHRGKVVRLTLNTPPGNILDGATLEVLQEQLEALKEKNHVKLIQFSGQGEHFSFGASIEEHTRSQVADLLARFHQLFYTLVDLSIPTAALVSGQCLGGGFELALVCDFLFADTTARMGQPEIKLGVFPPPASLLLPVMVGQPAANDLLLSGRTITAEEAQNLGLVRKVFPDREALESGVDEWVQKTLLPKSASSLRHGLKAARWQINQTLLVELPKLERYYLQTLMETEDANEGIVAFLERRKAEWKDQ